MSAKDIVIQSPFPYLSLLYLVFSVALFFIFLKVKKISTVKNSYFLFCVNTAMILLFSVVNMILFAAGKNFILGEYLINYRNETFLRFSALIFSLLYIFLAPVNHFRKKQR
ncbi:hypothetical protein GWD52_11460 [Enterobacteriaceae bacterium 4M9]|nr:hypothetical protein [Enterobacteriaceae bacterium 4M9]